MKEQPKKIEKHIIDILIAGLLMIAIAAFMSFLFAESQEEIEARQYNEVIQYHQEQGRDVWSDGEFIIVKK